MNTTVSTPTTSPEAATTNSPAPAAKPASTTSPNYDAGLRYGAVVRYAGDTILPVDDGGLIKFAPSSLLPTDLLSFSLDENRAIDGNPLFPEPVPSVADMDAVLATLQADVNAWKAAQIDLRDAASKMNLSAGVVAGMMKMRANYVQCASNGNSNAIVSAGFLLRNPRTPVGDLPAPINLLLTLNGTPGVMFLEWSPVDKARAYVIQMSPADTLAREWKHFRTCTTVRQKFDGMELGKVFAFRLAAIGGASSQSDWSAEVVRMAA
jgi:hypothetical protein